MDGTLVVGIVFGATLIAYLLGIYMGRALRMKDYGWKIGTILASVTMGACISIFYWPPKLGIDLSGGVILVYEVDEELSARSGPQKGKPTAQGDKVDMGALVQALTRRVNPTGVREVVIREYGANQVEIIIPNVTDSEIEQIKRTITKSGYLKFQIVANEDDHAHIIDLANRQKNSEDPNVRARNQVRDENGQVVAEWVPIAVDRPLTEGGAPRLKVDVPDRISRTVDGRRQALMIVEPDPILRVDGSHLRSVSESVDNLMNPCVRFSMNTHGAVLFGHLTSNNLPDKQSGLYRLLGIVMDNELISAPRIMTTITDDGQITGRFTQEEVEFLVNVLRAGRLPAVLRPDPISENTISPLLGEDTIRKGSFAIGVSLIAVLAFMLVYYRFSGIIACIALVTNLLLIVALMILISAAFTLPGLAGLVLTVGMSVDANVLVFERIREELNRGAALRMAIRNGFARATTTIVDANLTTLITALVLYAIGTDQIRGFAVTLILGIVLSMYTAIFCSRVSFDIPERKKWLTRLGMLSILGATTFDFLGKRRIAITSSVLLILVGIGAMVMRGERLFDIDFLGGTSVQAVFKTPMPIEDVRKTAAELADDVSVTQVDTQGYEKDRVYKIDTSLKTVKELEHAISTAFVDQLVMHEMSFTPPVAVSGTPPPAGLDTSTWPHSTNRDEHLAGSTKVEAARVARNGTGHTPMLLAMADDAAPAPDTAEAPHGPESASPPPSAVDQESPAGPDASDAEAPAEPSTDSGEVPLTEASPETSDDAVNVTEPVAPSAENAENGGATGATEGETESSSAPSVFLTQSEVTFQDKFNKDALKETIESVAGMLNLPVPETAVKLLKEGEDGSQTWLVQFSSDLADTKLILDKLYEEIHGSPYLLSSNTIGGAVAGKTRTLAFVALGASLLGIIAYIWIRFQHIEYGLAAVIALLHDVAFTVGAVAISLWLSKAFGFLLIDEFKISLPVVAALLTIIGYSLNDTIVVFDRVREVKGKSPSLTAEMLNASINQTLSRTLLTSTTTLLVVAILYAFGGQGIHGFAFALLVGVIVGTYSSIFVASPVLLWMSGGSSSKNTRGGQAAA